MPKAIALLSGGLDSTLAVLLLRRQGIDVTAVTFLTHFGCDASDSSSCSSDSTSNAARYGFSVKMCHLADKFIDIVLNPKFGHGRNMNPCIDCRILMLREAGELMRMMKADFVVTGEVPGQRPMSQRKETLPMIDREAGLKGLVLRPLSAKLMKPTIPEIDGLVDREALCGFSGRSRKPQMALAAEFGLTEYPNPAGGCLLTEPNFSFRLKELLAHDPKPALKDLHLLRIGRHFRLPSGHKVIAGRDEAENDRLRALAGATDLLLDAVNTGSPVVMVSREAGPEGIAFAASACARYSDLKHSHAVDIAVISPESTYTMSVPPAKDAELDALRVNMPEGKPARNLNRNLNRDTSHLT